MELENWDENKAYDRLGEGAQYETILGVNVLKHTIPVKPSRNLSIIIEVAARNFRLKSMGYDAAQELISRTIGRYIKRRKIKICKRGESPAFRFARKGDENR